MSMNELILSIVVIIVKEDFVCAININSTGSRARLHSCHRPSGLSEWRDWLDEGCGDRMLPQDGLVVQAFLGLNPFCHFRSLAGMESLSIPLS